MRTNRQQKKGLIITGLLILLLSVGYYIPTQRELIETEKEVAMLYSEIDINRSIVEAADKLKVAMTEEATKGMELSSAKLKEEITVKQDKIRNLLRKRFFYPLGVVCILIFGAGCFLLAGLPKEQE